MAYWDRPKKKRNLEAQEKSRPEPIQGQEPEEQDLNPKIPTLPEIKETRTIVAEKQYHCKIAHATMIGGKISVLLVFPNGKTSIKRISNDCANFTDHSGFTNIKWLDESEKEAYADVTITQIECNTKSEYEYTMSVNHIYLNKKCFCC